MQTVARVNWQRAQPVYEDMVSCLVSRLHDTAQRVDGCGGDGGRDVQVPTPDGLHVYELKSFTGRVSPRAPNRRAQVEKSLSTAARLGPAKWSLVVPIDPTPAEIAWFDGLRADHGFPLEWLGRTWLDSRMADHPALVRYYLRDSEHQVLDVIVAANAEQAALTRGVPDAVERLARLSEQLDEVSPHYRLDMARNADGVTVTAIPRYPGAELDAPVTVETEFAFDDTPAGTDARAGFQEFLDYGGRFEAGGDQLPRLTVGAPAGLGGDYAGGTIRLASLPDTTGLPLPARVEVLSAGRRAASIPVSFTERVVGGRGGVLTGADPTGFVRATLRFDPRKHTQNLSLTFQTPSGALPAALLPMLRFVDAIATGDHLGLHVDGRPVGSPQRHQPAEWVDHGFVVLVEALAQIQDATATPFTLPETITADDQYGILKTAALLAGDTWEDPAQALELDLTAAEARKFVAAHEQPPTGAPPVLTGEVEATICGHTVPLGRAITWFPDGHVVPGSLPVPDTTDDVTIVIVSPTAQPLRTRLVPYQPDTSPPGRSAATDPQPGADPKRRDHGPSVNHARMQPSHASGNIPT